MSFKEHIFILGIENNKIKASNIFKSKRLKLWKNTLINSEINS
jgi:hypothetical protein